MSGLSSHLSAENRAELLRIVRQICQPGKGILAADETPAAMENRFEALKIENTAENRRQYRQLLFTSSASDIQAGLSAVILQHETVAEQKMDDGRSFVEAVAGLGIVPGITLDKGWRDIPGKPDEVLTQGMDEIDARCKEYKRLGCHFAKWRMWIKIRGATGAPSDLAINEGARSLAMYALICQENGIVPIVEPDIDRSGDHDLKQAQRVFEKVNTRIYEALNEAGVFLEGTILKCSMVTAGRAAAAAPATPAQIGQATREGLARTVPASVPGVFFLSGGLSELESTAALNAVVKANVKDNGAKEEEVVTFSAPWQLSFCFGRALQDSCRKAWLGRAAAVGAGQKELAKRIRLNGAASLGRYSPSDE